MDDVTGESVSSTLKKIVNALKKAVKSNHSYDAVTTNISRIDKTVVYHRGKLANIDGIIIYFAKYKLFYFENASRQGTLTKLQKSLNDKSCPPPFYLVGEGWFSDKFYGLDTQIDFEELIFSIFSPLTMATIYNQLVCESTILSKHKSTIFETMETYWLGMDYVSTDSLVSVMESALRDLIHDSGKERPSLKFQNHIRSLAIDRVSSQFDKLHEFHWYPFKCSNFDYAINNRGSEEELNLWVLLDHTMDALNAFLIWFSDVLYKEYDTSSEEFTLNRHNIFHGFSCRKAVPVHYPLMLWSLLSLIYMESLFLKPRSCFMPAASEQDKELEKYFSTLIDNMAGKRRKIAKKFGVNYKLI